MLTDSLKDFFKSLDSMLLPARLAFLFFGVGILAATRPGFAQPAPVAIAEIPIQQAEATDFAPSEAATTLTRSTFEKASSRYKWKAGLPKLLVKIQSFYVENGKGTQIDFGESQLGENDMIFIFSGARKDADQHRQTQRLTASDLKNYGGRSAFFPPGKLIVATFSNGEKKSSVQVQSLRVLSTSPVKAFSIPAPSSEENLESTLPEALRTQIGAEVVPESICATDDRTASNDRRIGRIMPVGCTGWLIGTSGNLALTAGHCHNSRMQIIEFQVPQSTSNGSTQPASVDDQYPIIQSSIVSRGQGVGGDWAIFNIGPNSNTGQTPGARQGNGFMLSRSQRPDQVRVTGYGLDDQPPGPDPLTSFRNAASQTQQTENGNGNAMTRFISGGPNDSSFRYKVDTRGGNSGGPVIDEESTGREAIAIHTHAGCESSVQGNQGTSLGNQDFRRALSQFISLSSVYVD